MDENDEGPRPRYSWAVTWLQDPETHKKDFAGHDGDQYIGRIRLEEQLLTKGLWQWTGSTGRGCRKTLLPHNGYARTARLAAEKVETYWDAVHAYNGLRASKAPPDTGGQS